MGRMDSGLQEVISRVRERLAAQEQRTITNEQHTNREIAALREYVDDRLIAQRENLRTYVDQKFLEFSNAIETTPVGGIDQKVWIAIVVLGLFSAGTFIAFIVWLVAIQGR